MMQQELTKKYNLITAIAAVVGIVIGSGVFFKAQPILIATGGDLPLGIWAWIIGGLVMLACIIMFSRLAGKYEKVNGVVDYAENTCGKGFAYYIGRFVATIYLPCITSVLAWVTARYFSVLFDRSITGGECMCLAGFILIACFVRNALAPKIAGKIQVATMIIKLIPILGMAIVGTIYGLMTGMTVENFTHVASEALGGTTGSLLKAVVATAFAYEGWICVTSLNSEIKNSKRNLPIALISGAILIIVVYVLYYIGVAGGATNAVLMEEGATTAFTNIFGMIGGTILNALVVVSCLGTLNGLTMGISRCMYSLAVRNQGPNPELFKQVDPVSNMPLASTFIQMLITAIWLVYFYGANLTEGRFGFFNFDSSELPIITLYGMYIPIFIGYMIKEKTEKIGWRYVMPIVAIFACGFMVFAAIYAHGIMPYQESLEAEKKQTLEWKIDNAQHAIDELKTEITLEDEGKVIQARNLYDVLTPKEQEEIKDYDQLTRAEERIFELNGVHAERSKTLKWKIDNAQHAINELKTEITLEDEGKVIQARNLYDVLTPEEQEEIKDYNQLTRAEKRIFRLQIVQRKCPVLFYLIVFIAIIGVGRCFKDNKNSIEEKAE